MKYASVPISQIVEHDRWDAAFHIAYTNAHNRVVELKQEYPKAIVLIEAMFTMNTDDLQPIAILLRGQRRATGKSRRHELKRAIRVYPYTAYALLEPELQAAIERARTMQEESARYLKLLEDIRAL